MADRKPPSPRDVNYEVKPLGRMPEKGARTSVLEEALEKVKRAEPRDEQGNPVWCQIGSYRLGSAASAAANQLRKRHGKGPEVEGWRITTGRVTTDEDGNKLPSDQHRTILGVRYEPENIVEGAASEHREKVLKEKDQARLKRQEKTKSTPKNKEEMQHNEAADAPGRKGRHQEQTAGAPTGS